MKLRSIGLISTLVLGLLAAPLRTEAQQAGKVYRIGYLSSRPGSPATNSMYLAFQQGLRELGYVEGQNLVLEYRSPKREHTQKVAAELVRLKVHVIIVPHGPPLIRAVQRATRTTPIVLAGIHVDPAEAGLVDSLARPGGSITGLTNLAAQLHPKQLELLKEAFPGISRAAIIWPQSHKKFAMKKIEALGQALGIQIQSLVGTGRRAISLESAFSAISQERPNGLLVASFRLTRTPPAPARIREFTAKRRLPTIYTTDPFVKAGGLMSYNADTKDLFRRVATYIDKILKGAKPADLPIEQPRKFDLVINLKTAKELGLTIPPEFLLQATKVIK